MVWRVRRTCAPAPHRGTAPYTPPAQDPRTGWLQETVPSHRTDGPSLARLVTTGNVSHNRVDWEQDFERPSRSASAWSALQQACQGKPYRSSSSTLRILSGNLPLWSCSHAMYFEKSKRREWLTNTECYQVHPCFIHLWFDFEQGLGLQGMQTLIQHMDTGRYCPAAGLPAEIVRYRTCAQQKGQPRWRSRAMTVRDVVRSFMLTGSPLTLSTFTSGLLHGRML